MEAVRLALSSLWGNKLRSVLTLLGVVIGVASVIAVVTLVNGVNGYVATKVYGKGADVFTVSKTPAVITNFEEYVRYQRRKNLTLDDFQFIRQNCKLCEASGVLYDSSGSVVYGTQSATGVDIRGWTSEMPQMFSLNLTEGRVFTTADDTRAAHEAIIGSDIVDNIMGSGEPLGKEIRIDGEIYTVIGVGEKQGKTLGQSQDNWVSVPVQAFIHTYGASNKSAVIYIKAGDAGARLNAAVDEVRALERTIRHDPIGGLDSFEISTNETFVGLWKSISAAFGGVAVAIAAISLVVGGIVIMNIMLVSVTERTREIGIRKALGARRTDILLQFIIEAATMSLVGGMIGVMGGAICAEIISVVSGWPSAVPLWAVFAGLAVATGTGIFFGVYPARKAAMLDPIVALRAE